MTLVRRFLSALRWLDGSPLIETVEPYRLRIFETVFSLGSQVNQVLSGRAKKNGKSLDLILAALYCLLVRASPHGSDCILVANDEDQAADDLDLLKKLIEVNPKLAHELDVLAKLIVRRDGRGSLKILPARDTIGLHGKTYGFLGIDEMHGYRNYDLLEALAPDPTRDDALVWITTYDTIYNTPGTPLFDYKQRGIRGDDPRMFFSWYSADLCTDPDFADLPPEQRANPSMASWTNRNYLEQQRRRLPAHKFRRLHLNLPGLPDGGVFDPSAVADATVPGRRQLEPLIEINGGPVRYHAFADLSRGGDDDCALAIAHFDPRTGRAVLDAVINQLGRKPYSVPEVVRTRFAPLCRKYGVTGVVGDNAAGPTGGEDFRLEGIGYSLASECGWRNTHEVYSAFEPLLNAGRVELLDLPKLTEQLLGLVFRGARIDHMPGEHDDWITAAAGALVLATRRRATGRQPLFYTTSGVFDGLAGPVARQRVHPADRREDDPFAAHLDFERDLF